MGEELTNGRLSHFRNLIAVASADGSIDEKEKEMIFGVANRMGISHADIDEVVQIPEKIDLYVPKSLHAKIDQLYDLVLIMVADGKILEDEMVACRKFASQFGLDHEVIDKLLEKMMEKGWTEGQTNVIAEVLEELNYPAEPKDNEIPLEKVMFVSTNQKHYANGKEVPTDDVHAMRGIKIEPATDHEEGFLVTISDMDDDKPLGSNTVIIGPQPMKFNGKTERKIILKEDDNLQMSDQALPNGLTLYLDNSKKIQKVTLHFYGKEEKNIEYFK